MKCIEEMMSHVEQFYNMIQQIVSPHKISLTIQMTIQHYEDLN